MSDSLVITQLVLEPLAPLVQPVVSPEATIEERFEAFHAANPHVFDILRSVALQLRKRGIKHYGMKGIFEGLRWESTLRTSGEPWKLNNDYTSLYARKLMDEVPQLDGFFELRERRPKFQCFGILKKAGRR